MEMSLIGITRKQAASRIAGLRGLEAVDPALRRFIRHTDYPDVAGLLSSDTSDDYIAEFLDLWRQEWPQLSRQELTVLVRRIMNAEGSEAEGTIDVLVFKANCKHPSGSDVIFYPEKVFPLGTKEPALEQIVDAAMTGKVK